MKKKSRSLLLKSVAIAATGLIAISCDFPYQPTTQAQPRSPWVKHVRALNGGEQICNPSITQNQTWFAGSMLFLNLGKLNNLDVPAKWASDFDKSNAAQHDRLTIIDTSNTVRWYMKKPSFILAEFQDPEWSTHPDYIAFIGTAPGEFPSGDTRFSGYVGRLSDKKVLKFCDANLYGTATPHLWVHNDATSPATPNENAVTELANSSFDTLDPSSLLVDPTQISSYFGTRKVKIVFNKAPQGFGSLYYVDYEEAAPTMRGLIRPTGKDGWDCESPLISPDGNWVVFNCKQKLTNSVTFETYIQRLKPDAQPILIRAGGAEPHWYPSQNQNQNKILFCTITKSPLTANNFEGYQDTLQDVFGQTFSSEVLLDTSSNIASVVASSETNLARVPLQGGIARDLNILCTGYQTPYFFRILVTD